MSKAVDEFKERVPEIAKHLKEKIVDAHATNKKFKDAYASFIEMCRTALNPGIQQDAVDDMLVQHLLTERLIREIFDNPEFTRRNVIAAEIEKVIDALTSRSFDRHVFLKSLDRFYVAIENAARTITEWSDKQHFLNTVYERFFQGYSVKLADTMGIVYTPQPIVDFMCASVAEFLEKEFGKSLGDKDVNILDPCTGTGNFIVNLIRRIPKKDLRRVYAKQLFANEIMLLPYYIAALNIEHAYYEQTGEYEAFDGLCFVDTLDLAEPRQNGFSFMTEKNTERVERQKRTPITVIIGNPPYNVGQTTHNEQNQNRLYPEIDSRIKRTYSADSRATSRSKVSDPYVKFIRWATDRLEGRDGIVCFVTNNSFVHQIAFDGMRKHLGKDFVKIFHFDLAGNVRQNPDLSGTQYNVFGIRVGVGITVAIRKTSSKRSRIAYAVLEKTLKRERKLASVAAAGSVFRMKWRILKPDQQSTWLVPKNGAHYSSFLSIGNKQARSSRAADSQTIFHDFSLGVATHRDRIVYDFDRSTLASRVAELVERYNAEVDRYQRSSRKLSLDSFVDYDTIVWDDDLKNNLRRGRYAEFLPDNVRTAIYRPFSRKLLYFDRVLNARVYGFPTFFPTPESEIENMVIWVKVGSDWPMFAIVSDRLCDLMPQGGSQCFPFYVYNEDGSNHRENITDWALEQFRTHYKDKKIGKWDIFHYVYGVLHHPGYRDKFADNLKRELPRIPFAPDFRTFAKAGEKLAKLHLDYETLEPWKLKWIETPGVPLSYRVEKMKLSKDKTTLGVNKSLTLGDIPPETSEYRLGNRSALEWVVDQYQVSEDKRSGIKSDPNREDDEEYIVRLVGQVIRVSVETMRTVKGLPEAFA